MPTENDTLKSLVFDCLKELRAIHTTLKENNRQVRRKSTVAEQVKMLLETFPRPDWSAMELATQIGNGCTSASVRQTVIWKAYRKMQQNEQQSYQKKDVYTDDFINEVDEKLDAET
jgi:hypothetical protein